MIRLAGRCPGASPRVGRPGRSASLPRRRPPIDGTVAAADWAAYRDRFVMADGRVVDDANGGISHSEGQGYGLLLAFSAGDRGAFERIFDFTRNQLLIRDDGLAAWKWDPNAKPHIVDVNNASDGDILIAYALGLAGKAWGEPRYTEAAAKLATAIGTNLFAEANGRVVLKPGVSGLRAARPAGWARSSSTRPTGCSRRSRCSRSWRRISPGMRSPLPAPRSSPPPASARRGCPPTG